MSNEYNTELFNKCVSLIRRGTGYVEIVSELEAASQTPMDVMVVRGVINAARKFVETFQAESLEAAVGASKQGMSHFEISKRLVQLGFAPFDADTLAFRAIKTAEAEMAEEAVNEGLSTLKGAETISK